MTKRDVDMDLNFAGAMFLMFIGWATVEVIEIIQMCVKYWRW